MPKGIIINIISNIYNVENTQNKKIYKCSARGKFKNEDIVSAIRKLQSVVETTIIGQSQDLAIAHNKKVTQGQVLSMYRNKTAKYTFEGPIHLGAILAGCKNKNLFFSLTKSNNSSIAFRYERTVLGLHLRSLGRYTTKKLCINLKKGVNLSICSPPG